MVSTYEFDIAMTLRVQPSGGVEVKLGTQLNTLLSNPRFSDGFFSGVMNGSIDIKDFARRPCSEMDEKDALVLTQWCELSK